MIIFKNFKLILFFELFGSVFRGINDIFDSMPLYALYRNLSETTENDSTRRQLQMILSDMRDKCGSIGFLFLYFAKAARRDSADYSASVSAYVEFCRYLDKSVESQLVDDMQVRCHFRKNDTTLSNQLVFSNARYKTTSCLPFCYPLFLIKWRTIPSVRWI